MPAVWPFLGKKDPSKGESASAPAVRRQLRFDDLIQGMGDFKDLSVHDIALKFWLPEAARDAMEEVAQRQGESMSEMLRQFLAHHVYGVYAFHLMNDRYPGIFKIGLPQLNSDVRFSRRAGDQPGKKRVDTYWVPELGKNVMSMKLWLPRRMRDDLQLLADHSEIKLSQYVREIVISRVLGHGTLPKRPQMLEAHPLSCAASWEEGQAVEMRQVNEAEFSRHDDGEIRTEWLDDASAKA